MKQTEKIYLSWIIHEPRLVQTSLPGAKRRGNLIPVVNNQEIARFAGDDNFIIAQVVRSARLKGKRCRSKIKRSTLENDSLCCLRKN